MTAKRPERSESKPAEFDPLVDRAPSRYVVGIDLGTTNSAVAYVDTTESPWQVRTFSIPQLVAPNQVESRDTLPSFHYHGTPAEIESGALRLPWSSEAPQHAVGFAAREAGSKTPGRQIASAKSWLCHSGVDRTADLLPWQGSADVPRLSPVEVTARYLSHLAAAWQRAFPKDPLADQDVVITLPASFDEVARQLTVQAAAEAKLPRVFLIEEPQAAFYAWVNRHSDRWHEMVEPGQKILVCDIGGGTSDFTLIRVRAGMREGEIHFHRIAVGEHLILGGDNLDLALAYHLEKKFSGSGKLSPQQWDVLIEKCRYVKETMLGENAPERFTVNLPGSGTKVIGGSLQAEVTRDEVQQVLVEGFLPRVGLNEQPVQRQSGFQEFGLPYAPDAAISRYLASFLTTHRQTGLDEVPEDHDPARPDILLMNGGFFASPLLRSRLIESLSSWFTTDGDAWTPQVLDNDRLDLAVARGAAYYGMVRRGDGVRISANLARSYYIGVEGEETVAVCLIPGDAEPGQDFELTETPFHLTVSEPVEFPLFVSSTRLTDHPGDVSPIDLDHMRPLPPIRTVLRTARRSERGSVPVHLHARLTEIGTIELWCRQLDADRTWRLQFDIRTATQTEVAAHASAREDEGFVDESAWQACEVLLNDVFGESQALKPSKLMKELEAALDLPKYDWPTSLLRRIWEMLMELEPGRRRSAGHESRWLNLAGFALRPGYGFAVDDWRVAETWRTVRGKLAHPTSVKENLVLWRRISGGMTKGQQLAIAEPLLAETRNLYRKSSGGRRKRGGQLAMNPGESVEIWRLLGSLELLSVPVKRELGQAIAEISEKRKFQNVRDAMIWTLGRIGQRIPLYGPLNTVVPREDVSKWVRLLLEIDNPRGIDHLAMMQMARRTGDRHRDLDDDLRERAIGWLERHGAPDHLVQLVREVGQLDHEEQGQVFGEALPSGLRLTG